MNVSEFQAKWNAVELKERSAAQEHFLDLCRLAGHPTPAQADPSGSWFCFEKGASKEGGGEGFADVWKRGFFAWEYKGPSKDLGAAFDQLLKYKDALENPPLLVACDMGRLLVRTNFTGTAPAKYEIPLAEMGSPQNVETLRAVFHDPERLRPGRTQEAATVEAAARVAELAAAMRGRGLGPDCVARFLDRLVFCMFAEDVGLLPDRLFQRLVEKCAGEPGRLSKLLSELFRAMATGGDFGVERVAWFNGSLFEDAPAGRVAAASRAADPGPAVGPPSKAATPQPVYPRSATLEGCATALARSGDVLRDGPGPAEGRPDCGRDARAPVPTAAEIELLAGAARLDWAAVDPSIFGTLFERSMDPSKRSQLGAHFTGRSDIELLVDAVVVAPLRGEWGACRSTAEAALASVAPGAPPRARARAAERARSSIQGFLERLQTVRVLDPACGSGNFLYVALLKLKDLEKEAILFASARGLGAFLPGVGPSQLYGIEVNPYAFELARMTVWIGYLQWVSANGFGTPAEPVLHPLDGNFRLMDAIIGSREPGVGNREMSYEEVWDGGQNVPRSGGVADGDGDGRSLLQVDRPVSERGAVRVDTPVAACRGVGPGEHSGFDVEGGNDAQQTHPSSLQDLTPPVPDSRPPTPEFFEPEWPEVDFIVGNPPFLGGNRVRKELGDAYVDALFKLYDGRVPAFSDLCCYWFERARKHVEEGKCKRAGLLATQGIRGGANREVLKRVKETGDIFWAESDRPWVLDGANVHVSMVAFDGGEEIGRTLDGRAVERINSDLTSSTDITRAEILPDNQGISFQGPSPKAPFDIGADSAASMLAGAGNPNGRPNSDVLLPVASAVDIAQSSRGKWTIDFGLMPMEGAALYEKPFEYVKRHVYPLRSMNRRPSYAEKWWQYAEARPGMRAALGGKSRYIATPRISKHRLFVWLDAPVLANDGTIIFARSDDYFFGILQSRIHEVWALAQGTRLETRPRYTPTTCFETFPFPECGTGFQPVHGTHELAGPPSKAATPRLEDPRVATLEGCAAEIAGAARELDRLRRNWLSPPEWVKEETLEFPGTVGGPWDRHIDPDTVSPATGVGLVRYTRLVPKDATCAEKLRSRTLTNLYNARPAWLNMAHGRLDAAVCAAYGWGPDTPDAEVLDRLLTLNRLPS